eukprot:COSAG01_NODE_21336_length_906_cov_2.929368_2_plen_254_part_01
MRAAAARGQTTLSWPWRVICEMRPAHCHKKAYIVPPLMGNSCCGVPAGEGGGVVAEEEEGVPPTTTVVAAAGLPGWYRVDDTAFRRLNPQYRERAGATPLQAALQRLQLAKLVHGRLGVGVLVLNLPAQVGPDMLGAVGWLVLGLCPDPLFRWVANGESPSCMAPGCGRAFGMLTWRHHCRRCGLLACARCVGQTGWLVTWLSEEPPHAMQDSRTNGDYYHGRRRARTGRRRWHADRAATVRPARSRRCTLRTP